MASEIPRITLPSGSCAVEQLLARSNELVNEDGSFRGTPSADDPEIITKRRCNFETGIRPCGALAVLEVTGFTRTEDDGFCMKSLV